MLILEIEYLAGVAFAAIGPDSDRPDWPPQPDRIFSALVATWAAHGRDDEAEALEWLEALPPPVIQASPALPRTAPDVFVPPNDPRSERQKHARGVLPSLRSRQPRRFPAARPDDPVVRLYWDEAVLSQATFDVLQRLARDTAYVGHSASLARCWFRRDSDGDTAAALRRAVGAERRVYAGRLAELRQRFDAGQRPSPGEPVAPPAPAVAAPTNLFSDRWLILEHVAGDMPDIRASGLVARAVRDVLLSGYKQIGLGDRIPEIVSGHAPEGSPSRAPHLAVVPLPFAGYPYADGHVLGFAVVPPGTGELLDDEAFRRAIGAVAPWDGERGRRIMTIRLGDRSSPGWGVALKLSPTLEPPEGKRSLDPALYTRPAQTVATLTPVVLDRHVKQRGAARGEEMRTLVAASCRNIGLPEPEAVSIGKHSAFEGAPSAYPSGAAPSWMHWRLPPSLASRQLAHAVIRFRAPIDGPIILGAGRFMGLGLCRSLDPAG